VVAYKLSASMIPPLENYPATSQILRIAPATQTLPSPYLDSNQTLPRHYPVSTQMLARY